MCVYLPSQVLEVLSVQDPTELAVRLAMFVQTLQDHL